MPTDSPSSPSQGGGRRHFHRGRRGHDRRGGDRRGPPQQNQPPEQGARGDQADVEQIMRDIRARIAQRHGIELNDQQVHELAARRLESILDPRTVSPSLLDQLRKSAGTRPSTLPDPSRVEQPYRFEESTLYESPNAFVRFIRKLLNPILRLFFNPDPLISAMNIQARIDTEAAKREAERDRRQMEWNALHYEILQRLVLEVSKVSLEVQSLALRVESLSGKVDFNERRVRGIEGVMHQVRPSAGREREREAREREARDREREVPQPQAAPPPAAVEPGAPAVSAPEAGTAEGPRRRRRRRRGRRGGGGEAAATGALEAAAEAAELEEVEEGADVEEADATEAVTTEGEAVLAEPGALAEPEEPPAMLPSITHEAAPERIEPQPERVTPQLEKEEPAARETAAPEVPSTPPPVEPEKNEP